MSISVDKDDLEQIPKVLSEENTDNKNVKSKTIQFGTIDHIECETEPFRFSRKCSYTISNDGQKYHKHDLNKFLLGFGNVPENVSVEILVKLLWQIAFSMIAVTVEFTSVSKHLVTWIQISAHSMTKN